MDPIDCPKRSDLGGWNLSIRTALLPKDTNYHGTIFGGVILSHIDMAGAIEARRYCTQRVVTVSMKEVIFKQPVFIGDLISFYTHIKQIGTTSVTVEILVIATREESKRRLIVTEATVTYVAVGKDRKPEPIIVRENQDDPPAFVER